MQPNRWKMVGAYVAATAVLAAGVILLVRETSDDTASSAPAPEAELASMPFPSTIAIPGAARGSVGDQVTIQAIGFSPDPVAKIELYDGGRHVASAIAGPDGDPGLLTYPALAVGQHLLHAEVEDETGKVSKTPATPFEVFAAQPPTQPVFVPEGGERPDQDATGDPAPLPVGDDLQVEVVAEPGETPEELAARFGVEPDQVTATAPEGSAPTEPEPLEPGAPIGERTGVQIRVARDAGLAELLAGDAVVTNPAGSSSGLQLAATATRCTVELESSGAQGRVTLYTATAGTTGWAQVGSTGKDGSLELKTVAPGPHVYFARSGTAESGSVQVVVPAGCAEDVGWTGDARIVDGILSVPPELVSGPGLQPGKGGQLYLYLSVDGRPAVRIPSEAPYFAAGYTTDISALLPEVAGSRLDLEVWGGGDAPIKQAEGKLRVPDGQTMADIIGQPGLLELEATSSTGGTITNDQYGQRVDTTYDDVNVTYGWNASSSSVDEVMWQVVSDPKTASNINDPDLVSPFIVAAGISKRSDASGPGSTGTFTIDTAVIPGHEEVEARRQEVQANEPADPVTASHEAPGGGTLVQPAVTTRTLGSLGTMTAVTPLGPDLPEQLTAADLVSLPGPGATVYVRVVANPNGPAVGKGSNPVRLELPTPQPPEMGATGLTLDARSLEVDPGRAPNPKARLCGVVTLPDPALDPAPAPPATSGAAGQPTPSTPFNASYENMRMVYAGGSGTYCREPVAPDDGCWAEFVPYACDAWEVATDAFEVLLELTKLAYHFTSQIYTGVVDTVVLVLSKANPLCTAFDVAGEDDAADGCEKVTGIITRVAIAVVAAYFGIPPTLPTLEQLEAMGKGELAILAVELMKYFGMPCDTIKADPSLAEAILAAGDAAGQGAEAKAITDPCLAIAEYLIKEAVSVAKGQVAASVSNATGLPEFTGVPGFELKPDPAAFAEPVKVDYQADVVKFDADTSGLACTVQVVRSTPTPGDPISYVKKTPTGLLTYDTIVALPLTERVPSIDANGLTTPTSLDELVGMDVDPTITLQVGAGGGIEWTQSTFNSQTGDYDLDLANVLQGRVVDIAVQPQYPCTGGGITSTGNVIRPPDP
jgi:hypothetical protein